jgi:HlyD family secretion protein
LNLKAIFLIITIIVMTSGLSACRQNDLYEVDTQPIPKVEVEPTPAPPERTSSRELVAAEGIVVPLQEARLAFPLGGRLQTLHFQLGEQVKKGDVLAQLEDSEQRAALLRATSQLSNAEAKLADLLAGAKPEEIAKAEADLMKAQAALAKLLSGSTPAEIAEAQAQVTIAQAQLNQTLAGTRQEQLEAAAARMLRAEVDVLQAQTKYDRLVFGDPNGDDQAAVELQKATLAYEEAKAQHEELVNGSTPEQIAVDQARVEAARASLNKTLAEPVQEDVLQAQASVAQAQATLEGLKTGPTETQIAIAQTEVEMAQANINQAEVELEQTKLIAPFEGIVSDLKAQVGETVQPGAALMILGDTSRWQLETKDLSEADVARVREGQQVRIRIDALPEEEFTGKVISIAPISKAEAEQGQLPAGGEVIYTVRIEIIEGNTAALRWGMTAFIEIEIEQL